MSWMPATEQTGPVAPTSVQAGTFGQGVLQVPDSAAPPFNVYVDLTRGSDANAGNTPGAAFKTLPAAINALQQVGQHGGVVNCISQRAGQYSVGAPIAIVYPILIVSMTDEAMSINRTYSTPNGRSVWDCVTTVAGTSVSSATAAFTSADVGRICAIYGAGVAGGTYYDFFASLGSASVMNLTASTAIARSATTDPIGVKMSIIGDWNRTVADASISSTVNTSVVTSPTAAWTSADIGTEVVIAGAGRGGQALRGAIVSVSGNMATITATCTTSVTNARCAIGVNFGSLLTYHIGQGGIVGGPVLTDTSMGNNTIGAAIDIVYDDDNGGGQLSSDLVFSDLRVTSSDPAGAWEHDIAVDGSWNTRSAGPGWRRVSLRGLKCFGSRRSTETIRLNSAVHFWFDGGGIVSETTSPQGVVVLDPSHTSGGQVASADVYFSSFENQGYVYFECQFGHYFGRYGSDLAASGRTALQYGATASNCVVVGTDQASTNAGVTNTSGSANNLTIAQNLIQALNASSEILIDLGTSAGAHLQLTADTTAAGELRTQNNSDINIWTNNTLRWRFSKTGSLAAVGGALATTATDGFLYIPTCAGVPTGVPTTITGAVPLVFDTTDSRLYVYTGGAWSDAFAA